MIPEDEPPSPPPGQKVSSMLLGKSGEIAPKRMKRLSQSRNDAQLWMCLLVRTGYGMTDWFKMGTGVWQVSLRAKYIMGNSRLDELQTEICNLNQACWEKYQQLQLWRWYHSSGRKLRRTRALDEGERGEWRADLNLNLQKTKIMVSSPVTSW